MTEKARHELEQEREILKILLEFHFQNDLGGWTKSADFEDYINAALDRLIEIDHLLKNDGHEF